MTNLSAHGLRIERPFDPDSAREIVQLEIELPDIDEILWARGRVTFANLSPMGGRHADGQPRLWCSAGVRIEALSRPEGRLLSDYVYETRRSRSERPLLDLL